MGFCPPTFPIGAGPDEDHSCENWDGAELAGSALVGADFSYASLVGAVLANSQLVGARFDHGDLRDCTFAFADASSASFVNANLAGAELTAGFSFSDLTLANLDGADLFGALFASADLSNASLVGASLFSTHLGSARLVSADLSGADMVLSDLRSADLRSADLTFAQLGSAQVEAANFSGANLSFATGLASASGKAFYGDTTSFEGTGFDPVAAGWVLVDIRTCVQAEELVRLGEPANPDAFRPGLSSGPVLGAIWDPWLDHSDFAPNAQSDFAIVSLAPANVSLGSEGTLLCDLAISQVTMTVVPSFVAIFEWPVPSLTSLSGLAAYAQAGSVDGDDNVLLTNALDLTIGFPGWCDRVPR